MRCAICQKFFDENELCRAIVEHKMVMVCSFCAEYEDIPVIKKPTEIQLKNADKSVSVRERMERMTGMRNATEISTEQTTVQRNLSRLRIPDKVQTHEDVEHDFNWQVKIARRRKKFTLPQLSSQTGIDVRIIEGVEQGKVPKNFREVFPKLEKFLDVKILKQHVDPQALIRQKQQKILEEVGEKIGQKVQPLPTEDPQERQNDIGIELVQPLPQPEQKKKKGGFFSMFRKEKPKEDWGSFKEDERKRFNDDIGLDDDLSDIEMV